MSARARTSFGTSAALPTANSSQRVPSSNRPHFVQYQKSAPASSTPCSACTVDLSAQSERRPNVFLLDPQSPETRQLTVVAEDGQCSTELIEEELEMALAQPFSSAALDEPFACVLANRFEQAVPPPADALTVRHYE